MSQFRNIREIYTWIELVEGHEILVAGDVLTFGEIDPNLIDDGSTRNTKHWKPGDMADGWEIQGYHGRTLGGVRKEFKMARFWRMNGRAPRGPRRIPLNLIHSEPVPLP